MVQDTESEPKTSRRLFLTASSAVGLTGFLAGCNAQAEERTAESDQDGENDAFEQNGNKWLMFGAENNWGMRYNESTNEFEVVHKPLEKSSRKNIRIEADENGDKGDVYIDDTIIVKNEAEVSDGSANDPGYTFSKQNNTGLWRAGAGVLGVTTAGRPSMLFDNGTARVTGDMTTGDGSTTIWDSDASHTTNLPATSARASGDGNKTTFLLAHPLDSTPEVATVTPTSQDAAGQFWVSNKTADSVELTYASPPPSGTGNLSFDIVVSR